MDQGKSSPKCRYCKRIIRLAEAVGHKPRWVHQWSFMEACGLGRSTYARPAK